MSKYLDFDIAIRKLGTWYNDLAEANGSDDDFVKGYGEAMDDLADVPAADVQEVKHGKWDEIRDEHGNLVTLIHRECGRMSMGDDNYCPKCGALMQEEENAD